MKPWYERAEYKNRQLKTNDDYWQDVWDIFQETVERAGYDNSTGNSNYLIGRYIYEHGYDKKEFIDTIKRYLKELEE